MNYIDESLREFLIKQHYSSKYLLEHHRLLGKGCMDYISIGLLERDRVELGKLLTDMIHEAVLCQAPNTNPFGPELKQWVP